MYPRLSDLLTDLFGITLPFSIYSFGFMVAVAILVAGWLAGQELDRMYGLGLLPSVTTKEKTKDALGREKEQTVQASPSVLVTAMMGLAALFGVLGAKLFHILENLDDFARDPLELIFSTGGLTFFGGLIAGTLGVAWYVRKKGLPVGRVADAIGPTILLGYGIGRIGCYLAGDGDWGICSNLANKPSWIPAFLWSETFPRNYMGVNVLEYTAGQMQQAGMDASVCASATGVYPTMLYETAMCLVLFAVLWALRKHRYGAGWLFGLTLVALGVERFLIEHIRVNNVGDLFGIPVTQAQVISVVLVVVGLVIAARTMKKTPAVAA